ncbi:MAG: hypothetical protein WC635_01295 [Bacteriovorax sp.]|jgi:hypothetical protein
MKFILIAAFSLLAMSSFAEDKDRKKDWDKWMDNMTYQEAKTSKLEMIDKRITMMEEERKCINDSTDKPGMKECMKKMWDKEKEMKGDMKDKSKKKK